MRVRIDSDACQGHGQCVIICPQVFSADEQGFATAPGDNVAAEYAPAAERAEASCPERAIHLER